MTRLLRIAVVTVSLIVLVAFAPATPSGAAGPCTTEVGVVVREPGRPEHRFRRCGVPDFDQLRSALPNGGRMYCAPTAALDWMVYLADRGATTVMPGPGSAEAYAQITQSIASMGSGMSTDAVEGTEGTDAVDGLRRWFDQAYGGQGRAYFDVWGYWRSGEETIDGVVHYHHPSARELAGVAAAGSLVTATIGWYADQGQGLLRTGGHFLALASAEPDLWSHVGHYTLGFSDPASGDGDTMRQGDWTVDLVPARPTALLGEGGTKVTHLDKLWSPSYASGYLEGGVVIRPKVALLPDPRGGRRLTLTRAVPLTEGPGDRVVDALDGDVIDLALGADGVATTAVLSDGRLIELSNVDGSGRTVGTIPGATDIVADDRFRTAVLDSDGHITVLDRHHNPAATVDVPGATGLGFNQRLGSFVTFDGASQELVFLDASIPGNPVRVRRLALKPEGPPIHADATLSVHPSTGAIGLLDPGTNHLTRAVVTEGRFVTVDTVELGDGAPLDGLVADADGGWYSTREGRVVAFAADGTERPDHPFAGRPSGPGLQISQAMDLGEAPEGPNVLPQDAPQTGDRILLTDGTSGAATVGDPHTVTAELVDAVGNPLPGRTLGYRIAGVSDVGGTATTDGSGRATVSWRAPAPGQDVVTVWDDADADRDHDAAEPAAALPVTWVAPVAVATSTSLTASVNPATSSRPVTLAATVTAAGSAGGGPVGTVRFTDNGNPLGSPVAVDAQGRAQLTVTWPDAGIRQVRAEFLPAPGSSMLPSSAQLAVRVRCGLLDLRCILRSLLGPILG